MTSRPPSGLFGYRTAFVFSAALLLSLASLWWLPRTNAASWLLVGFSALFNVWSLYRSEHGGFVRSRHAPRAREPLRHYTPLQVTVVLLILMAQVGLSLFLLVERAHAEG